MGLKAHLVGASPLSPSWPPPPWEIGSPRAAPPGGLYKGGQGGGQPHPVSWHLPPPATPRPPPVVAWRSPPRVLLHPPPHRHAAGDLPQLLLSPCWIKKEETSPGCTCVERGGAVRSALDRIFRDLNRREYDSINRVLVTLPLSDLQGYEDALPLSRC